MPDLKVNMTGKLTLLWFIFLIHIPGIIVNDSSLHAIWKKICLSSYLSSKCINLLRLWNDFNRHYQFVIFFNPYSLTTWLYAGQSGRVWLVSIAPLAPAGTWRNYTIWDQKCIKSYILQATYKSQLFHYIMYLFHYNLMPQNCLRDEIVDQL